MATIYTGSGNYDNAIDQLEILLSEPTPLTITWLDIDPIFEPLRELPRYRELVERYGG